MTRKPRKKAQQLTVPHTDKDRLKEIDDLGAAFVEADNAVDECKARREGEKVKLQAAMKKHGREKYTLLDLDPPWKVTLEDRGQALKVKKLKPKAERLDD